MNKNRFEQAKLASLAHQLLKAGRLINQRGLTGAQKAFQLPELKQVHLDLFPHIDFEGTSISEIARRKGVSKQAVSKLVHEMVKMKLLYLKTDAQDSRSKRVYFHTSGPFAIDKGFQTLVALDQNLRAQLGMEQYTSALAQVSSVLELLTTESEGP